VFRRRSAGATDGTAQDSPGAQSPDGPAEAKQPRSSAGSGGTTPLTPRSAEAAKGRPTPKRSEAERNRRQPITGSGSGSRSRAPAAARTPEEKAKARTERARKLDAMKRGESWALNARDRGPAKALARDYIDSKRRVSEYYMYILVVLIVAIFIRNKALQSYLSPLVLVLVVVILLDAQIIRRSLRKLIGERLPGESTRGLTWYAVQRALQPRRFRIPAPRIRPGEKF
jgi:Protein of unknown function (DUF3043)